MILSSLIMNIGGSEWAIVIILGLILVFGPKKLPELSRTFGKASGEYEKAKGNLISEKNNILQQQTANAHKQYIGPAVQRPVSSEREKLEAIAKSLHINTEKKSDDEIRSLISSKLTETQA